MLILWRKGYERVGILNKMAADVSIPKMYRVKQHLDEEHLSGQELVACLRVELERGEISGALRPGMRVAVTFGSRGIENIALITKAVISFVQEKGAKPFIIPAMGSHGGATAKGQKEVLESYGVTEERMGCPICSSMEVVQIARVSDGRPVYIDRYAANADGIIVVNRIKPHTAFRGPYESGLMKMIVIGLGKQKGAEICHETGFENMAEDLVEFGAAILKNARILFGVGIIENQKDKTKEIAAFTPGEIVEKEPEYLQRAKANMPRIYFDDLDVLVVDRIGKNISGDGMDPNVTGRFGSAAGNSGGFLKTKKIVVLDLTEQTHGSALGIGMADVTTKRLFDKTVLEMSYPNAITSTVLEQVRIPMIIDSDKQAIQLALKSCAGSDKEHPRIVRIRDTLSLEEIYISEALLEEAAANVRVELLDDGNDLTFDEEGNLW